MKQLLALTVVVTTLAAAGPAGAWTMVYDGFDYEPASANTTGYTLSSGSNATFDYNVGDTRYYNNINTSRPLPPEYIFAPSVWVSSNSGATNGYWPFISPGVASDPPGGFAYTGLPAPTGHVVVCMGSSSNSGRATRVNVVNPGQTPPTGPFRTITRGTVYYSLLLKVIEAPHALAESPRRGFFHAGFNDHWADGNLPDATTATPALTRAGARLFLRAGSTVEDWKFQIGVSSDADPATNDTTAWDANIYDSGVSTTPMLVVVSYEFVEGTANDISRMWVNPAPATLGAASPPAYTFNATTFPLQSTGADINQNMIRSFFLREGGNSQGNGTQGVQRVVFDEVRLGTSWADVTSDVACTAPTVASIYPASGRAGLPLVGVQISGDNFIQGVTQVWLKMAGQPDIQGNNVNVIDPQHLVCNFNIPETAVDGLRDVVVITCPESPGTLSEAFAIGAMCNDPRYDLTNDDDVDMDDFAALQRCYTGENDPNGKYDIDACACLNSDGDTDIDVADFVAFTACASAAGVKADENCDNPPPP
jgi:hypothetical protein